MMRNSLVLAAVVCLVGSASGRERPSTDHVLGPFARMVSPSAANIEWETDAALPSIVQWRAAESDLWRRSEDPTPMRRHAVTIDDLDRAAVYEYRLVHSETQGTRNVTPAYRLDTAFDYVLPSPAPTTDPFPPDALSDAYDSVARRMVDALGTRKGYCLIVGVGDGRLAYHLARRSDLTIVAIDEDPQRVRAARETLDQAGIYGSRVTVRQASLPEAAFGPYFANLITSDTMLTTGQWPAEVSALYPYLRPAGGLLYVGQFDEAAGAPPSLDAARQWLSSAAPGGEARTVVEDGLFLVHRRPELEGAGRWTHQYGRADNTACSRDEVVEADLTVQWWGRPGSRPMPDRGPRNPAPVSANGYLFSQGDRVLFGMDAYNGTVLWSLQVPQLRRANMPRDCSNMVAADDTLYLALGGYCVGLDAATGRRKHRLSLPHPASPATHDWGYLASAEDTLVGSCVKKGTHYLGDDGEWYEDFGEPNVARVTSDRLFAVDRDQSSLRWTYDGGTIINSTITMADGTIWFVESTNSAAADAPTGRLFDEVQRDQQLVAVDRRSGSVLWKKPFDFSKCEYSIYLCHGDDNLIATGADRNKVFHTYALDAKNGELLWEHQARAQKTHHSGHLSHPVLIGKKLFINRMVLDTATGNVLQTDLLERRGCGTMAGSNRVIFYRHHYHGSWDLQSDERREYRAVRSSCWLGTIPAGGLLLVPESSAGCSCDDAIQTSMALVPRSKVGQPAPAAEQRP